MPWLAIAVPVLLAIVAFASTLDGGFLSDDFLLSSLWNDAGTGVDWQRTFADFTRSWFGIDAPLYRPLLTLSFGLDVAIWGSDTTGYHVTNLLLHCTATFATATVAAVLGARHGVAARAAICCGAIAAVHPAVVESVAWIAARNSGIEVAFRNVALALFALNLTRPSPRLRTWSWIAAAGALLCKESAVVLVACALAIDVLHDPMRSTRDRIRLHAPFWLLLVAYFALRLVLFGVLLGSPGNSASEAGKLEIAGAKLAAIALPANGPWLVAWFGVYAALLFGLRARRNWLVAAAAVLWLPALMAPTHSLELHADYSGGRMLLGAVHAFAMLLAGTALAAPGFVGRLVAPIAIGAATIGLWLTSQERVQAYEKAWHDVGVSIHGIHDACERRRFDSPVALVNLPQIPGVPPMNQNAWFPLGERPVQPADNPIVSLGYALVPVPGSEDLHFDAVAAHALWEDDVEIGLWDDRVGQFRSLEARTPRPDLSLRHTGDGRFDLPGPVHAFAIEAVRIEGAPRGSIRLRSLAKLSESAASAATFDWTAGTPAVIVDLTRRVTTLSWATIGIPITGFELELDGIDPANVSVTALARVDELAVPTRLDGADLSLDEFVARVSPPESASPVRLVLLSPHAAVTLPIEAGAARWPSETRALVESVAQLSRARTFFYYFETLPGANAPARSRLDSVRLH